MGLSWAAYHEVSEATVRVTPKCAHQWLAWKHMGPPAAAVGLWCALLSLPGCTLGRRQHLLCLDQGCVCGFRITELGMTRVGRDLW